MVGNLGGVDLDLVRRFLHGFGCPTIFPPNLR